jgi:pimeloyl-ACP methyl ester carboxylesterase
MQQRYFHALGNGAFHRIAYTEWGNAANAHVAMCVHGLARNSRDFDYLADALTPECRVVCMDVAGRGESDWLENKSEYKFSTYQNDAAAMLARASAPGANRWLDRFSARGEPRIDWVGTSMGGLIGMFLAAKKNSPIRRLVLNDVGALIPWAALFRMKGYITRGRRFATEQDAEVYLRKVCAPFGRLSDEQWHHLAHHSTRRTASGDYELRYDPAIGEGLHGHIDPEFPMGPDVMRGIDLWSVWGKVRCPTLVLRGAQSEVLLPATVAEMRARKPDVEVVEFPDVGHAPALMSDEQVSVVKRFLLQ